MNAGKFTYVYTKKKFFCFCFFKMITRISTKKCQRCVFEPIYLWKWLSVAWETTHRYSIVTRVLLHSQKNWRRHSTCFHFNSHNLHVWLIFNRNKNWIIELEFFATVSRFFSNIKPATFNIVLKLYWIVNIWHLKA